MYWTPVDKYNFQFSFQPRRTNYFIDIAALEDFGRCRLHATASMGIRTDVHKIIKPSSTQVPRCFWLMTTSSKESIVSFPRVYRPDINAAITGAVPGAVYDEQGGGWKYPTDTQIPDVWFAVGEQMFVIHPADFGFGHDGDGYTFGGIQSRGDSSYDIFGDVFLKNVYAVCELSLHPMRLKTYRLLCSPSRTADGRTGAKRRLVL